MRKYLFILFIIIQQLDATTLVYNMKIRRILALGSWIEDKLKDVWIATAAPIVYKRDRHIVDNRLLPIDVEDKRIVSGSLFNVRYIHSKYWWLEASTGLLKEQVKSSGTANFYRSRFGCDDIVLTGGYHMYPHKNIQGVLYGLAGFPTRRTLNLFDAQDPLVGSRFFGVGLGTEFSFNIMSNMKRSLIFIFQNRILHFFKRSWNPILPVGSKIQPGNVTDLLFDIKYRKKTHIFDVGYNPTFFTNQSIILPNRELKTGAFIRQSVYASYAYVWLKTPIKMPIILGAGFLWSNAKKFHTKIFAFLANLSVIF